MMHAPLVNDIRSWLNDKLFNLRISRGFNKKRRFIKDMEIRRSKNTKYILFKFIPNSNTFCVEPNFVLVLI